MQAWLILKVFSFIIRNSFLFAREYNIINTFYLMQTIAQTHVTTICWRISIINWTSSSCLCMLGIFFMFRLSKLFHYFFYTIHQIIMSLGSVCDSSFFIHTLLYLLIMECNSSINLFDNNPMCSHFFNKIEQLFNNKCMNENYLHDNICLCAIFVPNHMYC